MRGIGYALSRLPSARALFAGAAIIAGALGSAAHGQVPGSGNGNGTQTGDGTRADEVAFASARPNFSSASGVSLPRPLSPGDAALMRRIFSLQSRGKIPDSIAASEQLDNPLLIGSVLAERYLGRYHLSTVDELSDWLVHYRDQPDASAIRALLISKLPRGAIAPAPITMTGLGRSDQPNVAPEDTEQPRNDLVRDAAFDRQVMDRVDRGNTTGALRLVASRAKISGAYAAQLRGEIAQALFLRNDDAEALRICQAAVKDLLPNEGPSLPYYVGGLAAWRLDRLDIARTMFEAGASAIMTTPRLHAASAFWASRANRRLHFATATVKWLHVAASEPITLHGFLARRILRMPTGIVPSGQLLGQADVEAVVGTPQGMRALALLQVGQPDRAEAEFRLLWSKAQASSTFGRSLLMVVSAAGLTDCAAQMAEMLQAEDGLRHDELRFPLPHLRPAGGFRIDPALVYALTRVESNFDPMAVSPVGARGLMQIMPSTAQYVMGEPFYAAERLHEPSTNLEIGQRYVGMLAKQDGIGRDLIRMLASYNSGPGNFLRWSAEIRDDGDPLMFMEAIPIAETRAFVPTALVYSWIYAARLHLPAPSLDDLASGDFPRFTPMSQESTVAALAPTVH